uniref:AMP-dependent synthetase/ligase domain-containing protein n=1 Tax=Globisporangium ultimum (strain ATCC 200006 / CBS 805.95 / DAOM BR144) TaxID=431595 RepID=K3WMF5_GLOUD
MIYTSPYPDFPIPQDEVVYSHIERNARAVPNKAAFICGLSKREVTFAQLFEQSQKIVAGLHANGIKRGDVVIVHSFNCIEYPVVFFALNRLGAICSPTSPMFNPKELADQIELGKAKAVIVHKMLAPVGIGAAKIAGIPANQVYSFAPGPGSVPIESIEDIIAKNLPFPANLPPIEPSDVVTLPFSSGTTGRPKGVELTGRALLACAMNTAVLEEDVPYVLGMLPFFHIMATMVFHVTVYKGITVVVLPKFEPEDFLRVVQDYKITKLALAPPLLLFLAKHPIVDKYDLSHVEALSSGGAPLGVELERLVSKRLNTKVYQGYGMTEFSATVCYCTPEYARAGSVGRLIPNTVMKIKSLTTDEDLGPNQTGELLFRTPQMMKGYFNDPEANAVTFTKDGFLRTGDIGYIDDDGYIFIVDRVKELIKYKGHQVAPAELEDVLNNHPSIEDSCCVRGQERETGEEVPKAYVVRKAGSKLTKKDVMDYVASKVAFFKKVRDVEFIDAIPKSLSGKILRRELQVKENEKIKAQQSRL